MTFEITPDTVRLERETRSNLRTQWRVEQAKAGRLVPKDGPTRKAYRARYGVEASKHVSRYSKQWAEVAENNREGYLQHLRRTSCTS